MIMRSLKNFVTRVERAFLTRQAYKFVIRDWVELSDLKAAADVIGTMRYTRNLLPLEMERPMGRRILVLVPHPDDEVIGAMGTLRRAIDAGSTVHVVYLTTGNAELREDIIREIDEISGIAGYSTKFLDYPLNRIPLNYEVLERVADEIRSFAPDTLFVTFMLDDHDDHRRVNQVLLKVWREFDLDSSIEVWGFQIYTSLIPNVVVDITDRAEEKRALITRLRSRMAIRNWAHYALGLNAYNCRFLNQEVDPRFAETFFVLPLNEYCELAEIYFGTKPANAYYKRYYIDDQNTS